MGKATEKWPYIRGQGCLQAGILEFKDASEYVGFGYSKTDELRMF